jgi:hypothetical protein
MVRIRSEFLNIFQCCYLIETSSLMDIMKVKKCKTQMMYTTIKVKNINDSKLQNNK